MLKIQLDYLYENFLVIAVILVIIIVIAAIAIFRMITLKIGDEVFEFAENTLIIKKAKREGSGKIRIGKKLIARAFAPYLVKRGFSTKRIYLLEEDSMQTTDIYEKRHKEDDDTQDDKSTDAMKNTILESSVIDKMLSVFSRLGFSWTNFLFGVTTGMMIILMLLTGEVIH